MWLVVPGAESGWRGVVKQVGDALVAGFLGYTPDCHNKSQDGHYWKDSGLQRMVFER